MPASELPTHQLARLRGHKGPINALTYSSNAGTYLLSGSSDRSINLYNPSLALHPPSTSSSITNPTSKPHSTSSSSAAAAGKATPGLIQTYTGAHAHEVLSLAVDSSNSTFASGGGDRSVFVWDVATARTVRRFGGGGSAAGHGARVECVAWGGEGDGVLVSGSFDGSVRVWDVKGGNGGRPIMVLDEAGDGVMCVAVADGEVLSGSVDGRVRRYDLRMGIVVTDVIAQPVTSLTLSTHGDTMLVSSLDSTLRLMDKADGKMLQFYRDPEYTNTTYRIRSTLVQNDGFVLSGSEDGSIFAWDAMSGKTVKRLWHGEDGGQGVRGSRRVVSALACRKRRDEWASAGGDGTIVVWGFPA